MRGQDFESHYVLFYVLLSYQSWKERGKYRPKRKMRREKEPLSPMKDKENFLQGRARMDKRPR